MTSNNIAKSPLARVTGASVAVVLHLLLIYAISRHMLQNPVAKKDETIAYMDLATVSNTPPTSKIKAQTTRHNPPPATIQHSAGITNPVKQTSTAATPTVTEETTITESVTLDLDNVRKMAATLDRHRPKDERTQLAENSLTNNSVESQVGKDIQRAARPDCRTAHAPPQFSLLAAIPILIDTVRDKGCKW